MFGKTPRDSAPSPAFATAILSTIRSASLAGATSIADTAAAIAQAEGISRADVQLARETGLHAALERPRG